jgi:hypothetical protein
MIWGYRKIRHSRGRKVAFALYLLCGQSLSQNAQAPKAGNPAMPTLHVYVNLEQVPTLVLSSKHTQIKKLDPSALRLSVNSGPLFKPTHVRLEGEDPISLAILVDATEPKLGSATKIVNEIATLGDRSLHPQDHVSVYAMECSSLVRTADGQPFNSALLRRAVEDSLEPSHDQSADGSLKAPCKPRLPLWDSLTYVAHDLSRQPGWRVILVMTDGKDEGSQNVWSDTRHLAQISSVAIFGILPSNTIVGREDPFDQICQLTGGVETFANNKNINSNLAWIMQMVRGRYIVEYPRSDDLGAGLYRFDVLLPGHNAYVRPAGISVPAADPRTLADPTTVPSDPALAPIPCSRKVLILPK